MSAETGLARPDTTTEDENQREPDDAMRMDNNDGQERANAPSAGQLKCGICQTTFRRPEHLKRHLRSHTKEKPFECARCSRRFSRSDTLHRHDQSHHASGLEGRLDRTHRITVKTFRACFNCATARVRCSGGDPCVRCQGRSLGCQYPTERRSKLKAGKESNRRSVSSIIDQQPSRNGPDKPQSSGVNYINKQTSSVTGDTQSQRSGQPANQIQFRFVSCDASTARSDSSAQRTLRDIPDQSTDRPTQPISDVETTNRQVLSPEHGETAEMSRLSYPSYSEINSRHMYQHVSAPPTFPIPFASDPSAGTEGHADNVQPDVNNTDMDIEMANSTGRPLQMALDQNLFDQGELSAINWLPTNLLPGNTLPLSQGIASRPIQGLWSESFNTRTAWLPPAASADQMNSYNNAHNPSQGYTGDIPLRSTAESPRPQSQAAQDTSPRSGSYKGSTRSGDYYVDGDGARRPKYSRKSRTWSNSVGNELSLLLQLKNGTQELPFAFPPIEGVETEGLSDDVRSTKPIEPATYEQMRRAFDQLCCTENFLFSPFETNYFPSTETLDCFIRHYLDSFQPVYPIFHLPTFDANKGHWILTVAISAVGCHVVNSPEAARCASAFHEFIRRAIQVEKERYLPGPVPIWLLQAMLLNCIGLLHSGSARANEAGLSIFGDLVRLSNREKLLSVSRRSQNTWLDLSTGRTWEAWIDNEVRRRTGYCIWLLDCTLAYAFDVRPHLTLDDAQAPLPSHEGLWQAKSEEAWRRLHERSSDENVSLYSATQILYIEKKLVPGIGEFSHVLLVHALYQRMWEVGDYFRRPLSCWNPTAKKQSRDSAIPSGSVWLPGIPVYSKWRNSACDCLDILHWTANGTIAKAAGLEHPTVLHLHAARIVLLVPFREIRALATSVARGTLQWSEHEKAIEWHHIWRWVKHDQYKARLALIHAGSVLWYVRRYSTNAFHEPVAVFLATLTLWAYGSCHLHHKAAAAAAVVQNNKSSSSNSNSNNNGEDSPHPSVSVSVSEAAAPYDYPHPTFIHLDRPCDDELVQLFVREGHTMRGNVTGVGDICGPSGPARVLKEGIRTLSGLVSSWGIACEFVDVLTRLKERVPSGAAASVSASGSASGASEGRREV
ncbi:hypothetical protein VTN77DRAFT_2302 [Rasamsonia byssochlamydoides]|uniref:uncharacterized protein n=1 Tax=Rasamsonia byssochlamydoides TaxID=89139 RepID=UPI003742B33A